METATRPTEVDVHYDKLCAVCRYPIDNQGLCVMDAEHAGVWVPPAPQETPAQQELSRCPFCGGVAEVRGDPYVGFEAGCYSETCRVRPVSDNDWHEEKRCVADWNTRYRDPAFQKLEASLEAITQIAGNLTDEAVEAVGGINDARSRALMVVNARRIAREALRLAREETE